MSSLPYRVRPAQSIRRWRAASTSRSSAEPCRYCPGSVRRAATQKRQAGQRGAYPVHLAILLFLQPVTVEIAIKGTDVAAVSNGKPAPVIPGSNLISA